MAVSTHVLDGGKGARDLAAVVAEACEDPHELRHTYELDEPLKDKIEAVATRVYGADGVDFSAVAAKELARFEVLGYGAFPVVIAKTHLSISSDPTLRGDPRGWRMPVREVRVAAGAGLRLRHQWRHAHHARAAEAPGCGLDRPRRRWAGGGALLSGRSPTGTGDTGSPGPTALSANQRGSDAGAVARRGAVLAAVLVTVVTACTGTGPSTAPSSRPVPTVPSASSPSPSGATSSATSGPGTTTGPRSSTPATPATPSPRTTTGPPPVAAGRPAWASVSVATLWRTPSAARGVDAPALRSPADVRSWLAGMTTTQRRGLVGRADTQVLLGDRVLVLAVRGSWANVVVPDQPTPLDRRGYPGWVPVRQLRGTAPVTTESVATVVARTAWLHADTTAALRVVELSYGTRLPRVGVAGAMVRVGLPGGGTGRLSASAVVVHGPGRAAGPPDGSALVRAAQSFTGLPYLWAGRSGFGFDCSGLNVGRAPGILASVSEHLLVFPDRETADEVAADLAHEGFSEVRVVREALAGEDDSEDHEWAVHVVEEMVADETGPVESGLRDRFAALAEEHGGWYDPQPSD